MFQKIRKKPRPKAVNIDRDDLIKSDDEKLDFLYQLFLQRFDEEKSIVGSLKARAKFFLSAIGVIFSIIVTIAAPQLVELAKWDFLTQIILIISILLLGTAILFYLNIYLKLHIPEYQTPLLPRDHIESMVKTDTYTKRDLIIQRILLLCANINKLDKISRHSLILFFLGDLLAIAGIEILAVYVISYIIENAPVALPILVIYIILALYGLVLLGIILRFRETINNIKNTFIMARNTCKIILKTANDWHNSYQQRKQNKKSSKNK